MVFLYVTAIMCGFLCRKSRICTAYLLGVMYLMSAFCTQNADYENYENGYNLIKSGADTITRYWGYNSFVKIWASQDISFENYRMIFYFLVIGLMFLVVRNLTKNVNFVLAMYMFFPFYIDAVQMKSFLAYVISLLGLSVLFRVNENKKEGWRYFFCLALSLLATLIHFSAFFFFFATLVYVAWQRKKQLRKYAMLFSLVVAAFVYFGGLEWVAKMMNTIGILGNMEILSQWFERKTHFGFLVGFAWVALLGWCFSIKQEKNHHMGLVEERAVKFSSTVFLTLPFFVLNLEYTRLLRPYMILLYVVYANQFQRRETRRVLFKNIGFVCLLLFAFFRNIRGIYDLTLGPLLYSNRLLNF